MSPRYPTRTPTRAPSRGQGTSFQKFRADSLELSAEEKAFWHFATMPQMEDRFEAERWLGDEYRVL